MIFETIFCINIFYVLTPSQGLFSEYRSDRSFYLLLFVLLWKLKCLPGNVLKHSTQTRGEVCFGPMTEAFSRMMICPQEIDSWTWKPLPFPGNCTTLKLIRSNFSFSSGMLSKVWPLPKKLLHSNPGEGGNTFVPEDIICFKISSFYWNENLLLEMARSFVWSSGKGSRLQPRGRGFES